MLMYVAPNLTGVTISNLVFDGQATQLNLQSLKESTGYSNLFIDAPGIIVVSDCIFKNATFAAIWNGGNTLTVEGNVNSSNSHCRILNGLNNGILAGGAVTVQYCYIAGAVGSGVGLIDAGVNSVAGK
jgi:hypothetical protein